MLIPDLINGLFEAFGGAFIALSIIKLHREKVVRGVSWLHVGFFSSWGFWNLYFYPHLGQWMSFWGGLALALTNAVWLGQIVYYNWADPDRNLSRYLRRGSDAVMVVLSPGEHSWDGGKTWVSGVPPICKTPRYRHADK